MYKAFIRPILFLFDPEWVHNFTAGALKVFLGPEWIQAIFRGIYKRNSKELEKELMGLKFPNPIGLAAGFDKNAEMIGPLASFGFGFIEIGTLTPKAQPGNEKPRLFRLPLDKGLINRMGFNNRGVLSAVDRLKRRKAQVIIGGNIGKNKNTPNKEAYKDYEYCLEQLYDVADYFVVNVSSPNTPELRNLQEKEPLKHLLTRLKKRIESKPIVKPLLLKIAPDLTKSQLGDVVEIIKEVELDGVIATNTTISRKDLETDPRITEAYGGGGLSGKAVRQRSTRIIKTLRDQLGKDIVIIGVGGVFTAEDALEKLEAGADLVQIYTGFIYEGPSLVKNICRGLIESPV